MDKTNDWLYLDLKGSREGLCRAQARLGGKPRTKAHRDMLQQSIDNIDTVATVYCPQWSRFDGPELPEP